MAKRLAFVVLMTAGLTGWLYSDGPGDNLPDKVRRIPPPGVEIPEADKSDLAAGVEQLGKEIDGLKSALKGKAALLELLPDVQIYHNAVRYALQHNEFHNVKQAPTAKDLLKQGFERAKSLKEGKSPWTTATGLVVRGYVSKIDGSVQPYGLVVPASWQPGANNQHRLDIWFHGRGETLSELSFIDGRQRQPGEFTPPHAFVLHPYGRYCNANKFAGEIDTFEALAHVMKHYAIDENRIAVRGFSMGGAACWQFAVHYADKWVAAAPGAGFSETADFLKVFQNEPQQPTWYEKKLWRLYDCTDYALNLFHCPTIAYSGENDKQKQAADMMAKALAEENIKLVHIIGAKAGHNYTPQAKAEINKRLDSIVNIGRETLPFKVKFTTFTLRYNQMHWITLDGLDEHWERARVEAENVLWEEIKIETRNVSAFTINIPAGGVMFGDITKKAKIHIDDTELEGPPFLSDRSWTVHLRKVNKAWKIVPSADDGTLRKRHGLQGPIDDAFMDSFLMVKPTGKALNEKVGKWAAQEADHAIDHWRRQFRGEPRVKNDDAVNDEDVAQHNLVLWGDPASNKVLAKIADRLPIGWNEKTVTLGKKEFSAAHHVPVYIFPNPLNPKKYVVINSGFTYREYDYLNNARQVPKLPDYAVIDVDQPVTSRRPGGIATAGFFSEKWDLTGPVR